MAAENPKNAAENDRTASALSSRRVRTLPEGNGPLRFQCVTLRQLRNISSEKYVFFASFRQTVDVRDLFTYLGLFQTFSLFGDVVGIQYGY